MKKLLLTGIALLAIPGAAHAADVTPVPAGYDWSGFYIGVNAGAAFGGADTENSVKFASTPPNTTIAAMEGVGLSGGGDDTSFTGGALAGYNWQTDSIVYGLEADFNYLDFTGTRHSSDDNLGDHRIAAFNDTSKLSYGVDWFGTVRGRLGYAAGNLLLFGTGGLAFGQVNAGSKVQVFNGFGEEDGIWKGSTDEVRLGWTAGAGIEYGIDAWSLGVEYLYVDLGEADWEAKWKGPSGGSSFGVVSTSGSTDVNFSIVRATAKLRF